MIDSMAEKPVVSVIVPAYNCSEFLPQCMESLLAQSYPEVEIILVDDGSTDETGSICDCYADKYDSVKVFHQNNQGQSGARNNGLKEASGKWICYVDADDVIHPQTIEILLKLVNNYGVKISLCGHSQVNTVSESFEEIDDFTSSCMSVDEKHIYDESFDTWCIWAKLIDREIIEKHRFEEGRIYEDNAVVLNWLAEAGKVAVTEEKLYSYRINLSGTTKKPFSIKRLDLLWALEQRLTFCIEKHYSHLLGKYLIFFAHNTMYLCREVKKLNEKKLAKATKHNSLRVIMRCLKYSDNRAGVLLRAMKLWLLY